MFNRKTVFVCGAGTSYEVGLPLGVDLAKTIATKMDVRFEHGYHPIGPGDFDLYENIKQAFPSKQNEYQQAAWLIRDGLGFAQSIDDFLDQHRSNDRVNAYGKAAIVKAVLEAEKACGFYFNPHEGQRFEGATFTETWFVKFMYMLGRGIPKENAREIFKNVSFIVFNYDRCIEFFLFHALQRLYSIAENDARAIMSELQIVHPYGSIGTLNDVPFGTTRANYAGLAKGIKTYTEQADEKTVLSKIRDLVGPAKSVVFLGFAYHSQNMQMLHTDARNEKVAYGTTYGMSNSDSTEVHRMIARTLAPSAISLDGLKCAGLFDNYAKSLTGGD
jgi:hypothetical protein